MRDLICSKCGTQNRQGAKFCGTCGVSLEVSNQEPPQLTQSSPPNGVLQRILAAKDDILKESHQYAKKVDEEIIIPVMETIDLLFDDKQKQAPEKRDSQPKDASSSPQSQGTGMAPASQAIPPKNPGEWIRGYVVQKTKVLKRSNYYKVCMARCEQGHLNPQAMTEKCKTCRRDLRIYLIHETLSDRQADSGEFRKNFVKWPITPGILKHAAVFDHKGNQYVVTDYPLEPWESLSEINQPIADTIWIVENCVRIGEIVFQFSLKNYMIAKTTSLPQEILEAIVIGNDRKLSLADLTIFVRTSQTFPANLPKSPPNQKKYIFLIGQILYTLASGHARNMCRESGELSNVPSIFRESINRARRSEGTDLETYIKEIQQIPQSSQAMRGLRQIAGYGTDNGRQRDHNEDYVEKFTLGVQQSQDTPDTGLYAVADGMGGHQAGEKASKLVIEVIHKNIQQKIATMQTGPRLSRETVKLDDTITPEKILKEAVLEANSILLTSRQKSGSDRGTTITTALIVGNTCVIANVGDSRTYLLHSGKLEQVSRDHSLVARLLEAGVIKAEDVRSHPQRNQIYRTLGDKPKLDVDTFTRTLKAGDRLLLCSDGLWEMVLDQEIERIMQTASSPQVACDQLIEVANNAGGEDNISVIVVWIE
jgi:serine/threonine protein phosphatase PrpC